PCNELGLAAQRLSAACPHLCAPDAPCPRWAHHTPSLGKGEHRGAEIIMPDNGICERFHRTVLDEFYRVAFRKKIYQAIAELQVDLDAWLREYNPALQHPSVYAIEVNRSCRLSEGPAGVCPRVGRV